MNKNKKRFASVYINLLLIIFLFLFRTSGLITFKIGQISPIVVLPLIVAISMFFGEWSGAAYGFIAGLLMDSTSLGSSLFNSICMMLIGLFCGIVANFYLNKNIKSALALSGAASFSYYLAKFLLLYVLAGNGVDGQLFARYLLPGVLYTSVFIVPFYFLERKLKSL